MRSTHLLPVVFSLCIVAACFTARADDWRQFRGTDNTGASAETSLPTSVAPEKVAWKTPLPGRGPSSPIVVGDRVFVTCSSGVRENRLHLLCVDTSDGKIRWQRQLWATGHTACHPFGSVAANTPASDGERVFAMYSSNDLACFDLDGNLLWFRGLAFEHPTARNDVGMSSSPLVVGDTVIAQVENQGASFAIGLDVLTGATRWEQQRERDAVWASPSVLRGSTPQEDVVLIQSRSSLTAHQPRTGKELWRYEINCNTTASATTHRGIVYLPANGLHALKQDAQRDAPTVLWASTRLRGGNASPVIHQGRAYVLKSPGILVCGSSEDGEVLWQLRLKGPFWATPVVADGHLHAVNHDGLVQVVHLGDDKGTLVSETELGKGILASPAVSNGALYWRADQSLWKVTR